MSDHQTFPLKNEQKVRSNETVALFVSDVHLQETLPRTTEAFFAFLHQHAMHTQQLYLLGDLFEYWAGDDDMASPYNKRVIEALRKVSNTGVSIFWIAGNRDFLIGEEFATAIGATRLPDMCIVNIVGNRILLTHGDAQCTDDLSYMTFRSQVRQEDWQKKFLTLPLTQRKAIIADLRNSSRVEQRSMSNSIMDVNASAISSLFDTTNTSILIHGHTHRPGRHEYSNQNSLCIRYVLTDWNYDTAPQRGGWLGINSIGTIREYSLNKSIM